MKRIYSTTERSALKQLCEQMKAQQINAKVNYKHNCIDVFEESTLVPSKQVYVRQDGTVGSYRCRYEYVGPGKGDYVQKKYPIKETNYTIDEPYVKDVKSTNIQTFISRICECYDTGISRLCAEIRKTLRTERCTTEKLEQLLNSSDSQTVLLLYQSLRRLLSDDDIEVPYELIRLFGLD